MNNTSELDEIFNLVGHANTGDFNTEVSRKLIEEARAKLQKLIVEARIAGVGMVQDAMLNDMRPLADWHREPFECVHEVLDECISSLKGSLEEDK
jgi:uncharacterized metal-binding protein